MKTEHIKYGEKHSTWYDGMGHQISVIPANSWYGCLLDVSSGKIL